MRFCKSILITAAISVLPLATQAANVKSNPTLSIVGMTFDDFSRHITSEHPATPGGCGAIDVSPIKRPEAGLQFSSDFNPHSSGLLSFDDAALPRLRSAIKPPMSWLA